MRMHKFLHSPSKLQEKTALCIFPVNIAIPSSLWAFHSILQPSLSIFTTPSLLTRRILPVMFHLCRWAIVNMDGRLFGLVSLSLWHKTVVKLINSLRVLLQIELIAIRKIYGATCAEPNWTGWTSVWWSHLATVAARRVTRRHWTVWVDKGWIGQHNSGRWWWISEVYSVHYKIIHSCGGGMMAKAIYWQQKIQPHDSLTLDTVHQWHGGESGIELDRTRWRTTTASDNHIIMSWSSLAGNFDGYFNGY